MVRMEDVVKVYKIRVNDVNEFERSGVSLRVLIKAYPSVSKPALWRLLERYCMTGKSLETLNDSHECTEHKDQREKNYG